MKKICTHSGIFHADDVCAAAVLLRISPGAEVVRSRNPRDWAEADVVFDVGGEYAPERGRFDHHQVAEGLPCHPDGTPYSSFGMIWDEFGGRYVEEVLSLKDASAVTAAKVVAVARTIMDEVVRPVDAVDNGIEADTPIPGFVRATNSAWWEKTKVEDTAAFLRAVAAVAVHLEGQVRRVYGLVLAAEKAAEMERPRQGLVVLREYFPWDNFVGEDDLFVVYPGDNGNTVLKTVPVAPGSFTSRQPLPEAWVTSKPAGAEFVHKNRFIAVFATADAAIAAAESLLP